MSDQLFEKREPKTPMSRFLAYLCMSSPQRMMAFATSREGNGDFAKHLTYKRVNGKWRVRK